jgi:hypothetical protein
MDVSPVLDSMWWGSCISRRVVPVYDKYLSIGHNDDVYGNFSPFGFGNQ